MSPYHILQCPACGHYQTTQSAKTLKCKFCNKSTTIISKGGYTTVNVFATCASATQAAEYVKEANEKRQKRAE